MKVMLNGEPHELDEGANVSDTVQATGAQADGRGVAAAVDGAVVPRGQWAKTQLEEGQRVEVLQAVQGG
jgi:sulfur carrier protein